MRSNGARGSSYDRATGSDLESSDQEGSFPGAPGGRLAADDEPGRTSEMKLSSADSIDSSQSSDGCAGEDAGGVAADRRMTGSRLCASGVSRRTGGGPLGKAMCAEHQENPASAGPTHHDDMALERKGQPAVPLFVPSPGFFPGFASPASIRSRHLETVPARVGVASIVTRSLSSPQVRWCAPRTVPCR
jgi:hypothetical protein